MVVVCFSEPLMRRMSSADKRLERFASRSCSASLTSRLSLFHLSVGGFRMCCRSELDEIVLSGFALLDSPFDMEWLTFDVCVHCCLLFLKAHSQISRCLTPSSGRVCVSICAPMLQKKKRPGDQSVSSERVIVRRQC